MVNDSEYRIVNESAGFSDMLNRTVWRWSIYRGTERIGIRRTKTGAVRLLKRLQEQERIGRTSDGK